MTERNKRSAHGRMSSVSDRTEYRIMVALAFSLCLVTVLCRRIFAGVSPSAAPRESIVSEAYSTAMAAVGYAFIA